MQYQVLNDILKNLIKNLGIERQILENQAIFYWPIIAGPQIAKISSAEKIKDGILFIRVNSDVWRNELLFYKKDFIQKLNKKLGKTIIFDIILV